MPLTPTAPALFFEQHGTEGPPVLFCMGLGMRGRIWQPQIEGLQADHRLVTYDNPGIGRSEDHARPYSMTVLAQDALRVADAAGLDEFHLVGVSMGGMVAQHVALAAPGRLRSLSLIATQPGGAFAWFPPLHGVPLFMRANFTRDPKTRIAALQRLLYPDHFAMSGDQEALSRRMAEQVGVPNPIQTQRRQLRAVLGHRAGPKLAAVTVPTLVLKPEDDALVRPTHSDALARYLPNARLERLPGAGHGAIFQSAELVNRLVREHIAEQEQGLRAAG